MPPEFPRTTEQPEPGISAWFAQEDALLERATRLARDERLARSLLQAVMRTTRLARRSEEQGSGPG